MSTSGARQDPRCLGYEQPGPTVLRMLVGAQLRRMREAAGITRDQAANAIRGSASKISRLEHGRTGSKARDLEDLLTLYDVTDKSERSGLLALASQAKAPGWWQAYADVVPGWFEHYLGLEQAADVIRVYEPCFVPGLLQTEDYARAVVRRGLGGGPAALFDQRVELRMCRQQAFYRKRPDPPRLWAVLDEAVLRRPVGSRTTMRGQLRHLIELAKLPNVAIHVMPFGAGGPGAVGAPVSILRLPGQQFPDVVYLEQPAGAVYPDRPAEVTYYWHLVNQLVTEAFPPEETTDMLRQLLRKG